MPEHSLPIMDAVGHANVFDWMHSEPFASANVHTPADRIVPSIPDDKPIFVDEETGNHSPAPVHRIDTEG